MHHVDPAATRAPARPANPVTLDMTGVDPLRLSETRRRVAVVKAFLAIADPTDGERSSHASALGLSVNQFLALVRAWREHGRASAMSGAGAAKGTPRPNGPRNLPPESKMAALKVLAALGSAASLVEAVRAIDERCVELGIKSPSRNIIWNMMMARRRDGEQAGRQGVVVSRCHVKLPVDHGTRIDFPEITLVVDTLDGAVLAAAMELDTQASVVAEGLERVVANVAPIVDAELAPAIGVLTAATLIRVKPSAARTATAKTLGRGFGTLDLIYQRGRSVDPAAMLRSKKDKALAPDDARRIIAEQLAAHNAARGANPPILSWID